MKISNCLNFLMESSGIISGSCYLVAIIFANVILQGPVVNGHQFSRKSEESEIFRKILILSPFGVPSQNVLFRSVVDILAASTSEKYEITYVTNSEEEIPFPNVKVVQPLNSSEFMSKYPKDYTKAIPALPFPYIVNRCLEVYNNTEFLRVMKPESYDLVIFNGFLHECFYGLLHQMRTPFIPLLSGQPPNYLTEPLGSFLPLSSSPLLFTNYSDSMTFFERVKNVGFAFAIKGLVNWLIMSSPESVYRENLLDDNLPGVSDILRNASILFTNNHFSVSLPRPFLPDVVEIGGIHCREGKGVPKDIEKFISEADQGVIYFSLDSITKVNQLPPSLTYAVMDTISLLDQRVIWRLNVNESLDELDDKAKHRLFALQNLMLLKQAPEQDILAHPNVKLFINDGGMLSIQNGVYHAVPMITIPLNIDAPSNSRRMVELGSGISIPINKVSNSSLISAIETILNDNHEEYLERTLFHSSLFRDRINSPQETLLYWVDYVIRHQGAVELRSASRNLNAVQYYCLDVFLFYFIVLAFMKFVLSHLIRRCCSSHANPAAKEKTS